MSKDMGVQIAKREKKVRDTAVLDFILAHTPARYPFLIHLPIGL